MNNRLLCYILLLLVIIAGCTYGAESTSRPSIISTPAAADITSTATKEPAATLPPNAYRHDYEDSHPDIGSRNGQRQDEKPARKQ